MSKSTPFSYYSKSFLQNKIDTKSTQSTQPSNIDQYHSSSTHSLLPSDLFDHDNTTDASEVNSPIHTSFSYNDNVNELKSLEENFKRIIDENEKSQQSKSTTSITTCPSTSISTTLSKPLQQQNQEQQQQQQQLESLPIQTPETSLSSSSSSSTSTFADYLSEDISSDESELKQLSSPSSSKSTMLLQYRHDERHNLAFPDVCTFPVRFDPVSSAKQAGFTAARRTTRVRALKKRAILSGKASEMVAAALSVPPFEFNIF